MAQKDQNIIITGTAGFIGFHLAQALLEAGWSVTGIDNINNYYDRSLKTARLKQLECFDNFCQVIADLQDFGRIVDVFDSVRPRYVVHLAAQAGVRYSLENPRSYIKSNLDGFLTIIEACKKNPVEHLIYASSSSVYGANEKVPFLETDPVERPVSLYAATKRANELMAQTYSHLYNIPSSGLRFFTVYGPWGRPDMAYYHFTKSIFEGRYIDVFNGGRLSRDFTYIGDVIKSIMLLLKVPPLSSTPHAVFNIGSHAPIELEVFIDTIATAIGKPANKVYRPMQAGDVMNTYASVEKLSTLINYTPTTPLAVGIQNFIDWYRTYHNIPVERN
ncbi:NAD-dependent epimerase/dehydratase family protein [Methylobacterium mesophilicum]